MAIQTVFKRHEIKYRITRDEQAAILAAMDGRMALDRYGRTLIRNLYFDTDDFRIIRRSLEKPVYKEKLRVRSYGTVTAEDPVFVELKKKYKSVVYKRRLVLPENIVMNTLARGAPMPVTSQIGDEVAYFMEHYGTPTPKVHLSYEREAYFPTCGGDLRITFDDHILWRTDDLSLCSPVGGVSILDEGTVLMEVKTAGAMPLWLTDVLTREHIFKTSFSKYGTAYLDLLQQQRTRKGINCYA